MKGSPKRAKIGARAGPIWHVRGTTRHKINPYNVVVGGFALSSEGVCILGFRPDLHRVQGAVATWVKTGENPAAARRETRRHAGPVRLRARHPLLGRGIISPALSSHPGERASRPPPDNNRANVAHSHRATPRATIGLVRLTRASPVPRPPRQGDPSRDAGGLPRAPPARRGDVRDHDTQIVKILRRASLCSMPRISGGSEPWREADSTGSPTSSGASRMTCCATSTSVASTAT